jgi:uncharacterized membrane protein (UPF0182 family)
LRSEGEKSIPQMKKIILYYNGKIIMEDNIEDALSKLFDYNKVIEETQDKVLNKDNEVSEEVLKSVKEANDLYNKAIEAQKNGDWSKYGEYIEQLGSLLKELSE